MPRLCRAWLIGVLLAALVGAAGAAPVEVAERPPESLAGATLEEMTMPAPVLRGLQDLVRQGPALAGERYHPLFSVLALNPDAQRDLRIAGPLHARLGPAFARRLDDGRAPARALRLAMRAHREAAREVERFVDLRALQLGVEAGNGSTPEGIWTEAENLLPWSFYGADVAASAAMARGIARGDWEPSEGERDSPYERGLRGAFGRLGLWMSEAGNGDEFKVQKFMNERRTRMGLPESRRVFESFGERFDGKSGRCVIVRDNKRRIVATAAYLHARPGVCELQMIYTDEAWKGDLSKRLDGAVGEFHIAKSLIKLMMETASFHGYDLMILATRWDSQQAAFRTYTRLGFLPSAESFDPLTAARRRKRDAYKPWGFADLMRGIRPAVLRAEFGDGLARWF